MLKIGKGVEYKGAGGDIGIANIELGASLRIQETVPGGWFYARMGDIEVSRPPGKIGELVLLSFSKIRQKIVGNKLDLNVFRKRKRTRMCF